MSRLGNRLRAIFVILAIFGAAGLPSPRAQEPAGRKDPPATRPGDGSAKEVVSKTLPGLKLVRIAATGKTFTMGSPATEKGHARNEMQHEVSFTSDYYLGVTHVTRGQFAAFVKDAAYKTDAEKGDGSLGWDSDKMTWVKDKTFNWGNAGFAQMDDHPVVNVSWNDAMAFCRWLSGKDGRDYRLPTEAQWEFACRAGTKTAYSFGNNPDKLGAHAWFTDNSDRATHPVGGKKANPWGLSGMHGNAWQWCADWYDDYPKTPVIDPKGPSEGSYRVYRGGGFRNSPLLCRSAYRFGESPGYRNNALGFRVSATVR